jgi:spore coat protein U-like protein
MTVDNFSSTPNGTGTLTAGTQNITVGGTLNVGAAQASGSYTGTFSVTVNYN